MNISTSFSLALSVLEQIKDLNVEGAFVDAYQNGREQGICINKYPNCYYVCSPRHSDGLVVYKGSSSNQGISEDAYRNATYFDTVENCVKFLKDELGLLTYKDLVDGEYYKEVKSGNIVTKIKSCNHLYADCDIEQVLLIIKLAEGNIDPSQSYCKEMLSDCLFQKVTLEIKE